MGFFAEHRFALIFYGSILILLYLNRKKFEVHAKIVYLYKTKIGLNLMDKLAKKYNGFVKILGYSGIGIGFIAMVFVFLLLTFNLFNLVTKPAAISGVSPIIPGIKIPGSPVVPPLIIGWIALFVIIIIHEFSHGVVARAHKLKVKSSGILFFGPIMGAFVEPDEKKFQKRDPAVQYSVFAAGSFSNLLLAVITFLILTLAVVPIENHLTAPIGFSATEIKKDYPLEKAGYKPGEIITSINGKQIKTFEEFQKEYRYVKPGEEIAIKTNIRDYNIKTLNEEGKPIVGIADVKNERQNMAKDALSKIIFFIFKKIRLLLEWIANLSLGIGIINLLPLGPIDGGRMMHTALHQIFGDKRKAIALFAKITSICIILLLLNIFYPGLKYLVKVLF